MAKGGRRKCGSGDVLHTPSTTVLDESPTKEPPSKDPPIVGPQLKAPLVKERPLEGPSTNAYFFRAPQGKAEELDAAAATRRPSSKDIRQSPGDPPSKPYFGSPRDRSVHTGRHYVLATPPIDEHASPAASRRELLHVGSSGGYVFPRREAPHERHRIQTSPGRLYAPYPHRPLEAGFFGGPEAIRQLEKKWSGLHSRDSRQSPTPPTPPLATRQFINLKHCRTCSDRVTN